MRHQWFKDIYVDLYWIKMELIRRWRLDTPLGVMGIIALLSGVALFIVIGQGIAEVFRGMIPWVAGGRVGTVYWSSIAYALKASFVFLIFCVSVLLFAFLRIFYRR